MARIRFPGKQLERLRSAAAFSRRALEPFCDKRNELVQSYVGAHYGTGIKDEKVLPMPLNMFERHLSAVVPRLVPHVPRALCTTPHLGLKPYAHELQLALNHLSREIRLERTLRTVVIDAMFGIGIAKVAMATTEDEAEGGETREAGQPFCRAIDLEDWVHDGFARSWEEVQFMGHRYRLPKEHLVARYSLDRTRANQLETGGYDTEKDGRVRIGSISREEEGNEDPYRDVVECWEYYLPAERLQVTLAEGIEEPVYVCEWDGPDIGPYLILGFNHVPGQLMPLAPLATLLDLHRAINRVARKTITQAGRQKTNLVYAGAASEDADRITNATDGEAVRVERIADIKEVRYGGPDQLNQAALLQFEKSYNDGAGNLSLLAGLGPQSETAAQDQLLAGAASERIRDMQETVTAFSRETFRALAWWLHHDDAIQLPLVKRPPGMDVEVHSMFSPEQREGDWLDFNVDIEPFSLQTATPQQRGQLLRQMFVEELIPALPLLQQAGLQIDMQTYVRLRAEYANVPELMELMAMTDPMGPVQPGAEQGNPAGMPKPAQTKRTYERINRPGASRGGQNDMMMRLLAGGSLQDSEAASLGRSAS